MNPVRTSDFLALGAGVTLAVLDLVEVVTMPTWMRITLYIGLFIYASILLAMIRDTETTPCTDKSDHRFQYAHTHDDGAYTFTCDRCGKRIIMRTADNASAAGFTDDTVDNH